VLWAKGMPIWDENSFGRYQIERYIPENDEFYTITSLTQPQTGFYRFTLENNNRKLETNAYFNDENGNWICGDFYGLRFLSRQNSRVCTAFYSDTKNEFLMPLSDRWPIPYERPLILASGHLPRRLRTEQGTPLLSYEGISSELALRLCGLLDLKLEGC